MTAAELHGNSWVGLRKISFFLKITFWLTLIIVFLLKWFSGAQEMSQLVKCLLLCKCEFLSFLHKESGHGSGHL